MRIKEKIKSVSATVAVLLILLSTSVTAAKGDTKKEEKFVGLGGMPFGVSFRVGELKIGGFNDIETENGVLCPAKSAGIEKDDIILSVNGQTPESAVDVTEAVKSSEGKMLEFVLLRGEDEISVSVVPVQSKETGDYCLGVWLDDGVAGLGTVTYVEEKTGEFGGLGHGIMEREGETLAEINRGIVSEVKITGVNKGSVGTPGELIGDFLAKKLGVITKNANEGVFGVITQLPENTKVEKIALGSYDEVKNGGATILCTVGEDGVCEYGIEITRMESADDGNKNFLVTVTDSSLIEKTGGIVRGMSGSPIIQNGKLVGAVTHVLVDDPTRGYGIFIENMLDAGR